MESIPVCLDTEKFTDFREKNAVVSRTEGVFHVIHLVFARILILGFWKM